MFWWVFSCHRSTSKQQRRKKPNNLCSQRPWSILEVSWKPPEPDPPLSFTFTEQTTSCHWDLGESESSRAEEPHAIINCSKQELQTAPAWAGGVKYSALRNTRQAPSCYLESKAAHRWDRLNGGEDNKCAFCWPFKQPKCFFRYLEPILSRE